MIEVTDVHFRRLLRIVSPRTDLYTPMIIDSQVLCSSNSVRSSLCVVHPLETLTARSSKPPEATQSTELVPAVPALLTPAAASAYMFPPSSPAPVAADDVGSLTAQISGSDAHALFPTAMALYAAGADVVNLNMGCPASSAQQGTHGAALMTEPSFPDTAAILHSAILRVRPDSRLSAKFRLGVNAPATYPSFLAFLCDFAERSGLPHLIAHARVALLDRSPRDNLSVPPLRPRLVARARAGLRAFLAALVGRRLPLLAAEARARGWLSASGGDDAHTVEAVLDARALSALLRGAVPMPAGLFPTTLRHEDVAATTRIPADRPVPFTSVTSAADAEMDDAAVLAAADAAQVSSLLARAPPSALTDDELAVELWRAGRLLHPSLRSAGWIQRCADSATANATAIANTAVAAAAAGSAPFARDVRLDYNGGAATVPGVLQRHWGVDVPAYVKPPRPPRPPLDGPAPPPVPSPPSVWPFYPGAARFLGVPERATAPTSDLTQQAAAAEAQAGFLPPAAPAPADAAPWHRHLSLFGPEHVGQVLVGRAVQGDVTFPAVFDAAVAALANAADAATAVTAARAAGPDTAPASPMTAAAAAATPVRSLSRAQVLRDYADYLERTFMLPPRTADDVPADTDANTDADDATSKDGEGAATWPEVLLFDDDCERFLSSASAQIESAVGMTLQATLSPVLAAAAVVAPEETASAEFELIALEAESKIDKRPTVESIQQAVDAALAGVKAAERAVWRADDEDAARAAVFTAKSLVTHQEKRLATLKEDLATFDLRFGPALSTVTQISRAAGSLFAEAHGPHGASHTRGLRGAWAACIMLATRLATVPAHVVDAVYAAPGLAPPNAEETAADAAAAATATARKKKQQSHEDKDNGKKPVKAGKNGAVEVQWYHPRGLPPLRAAAPLFAAAAQKQHPAALPTPLPAGLRLDELYARLPASVGAKERFLLHQHRAHAVIDVLLSVARAADTVDLAAARAAAAEAHPADGPTTPGPLARLPHSTAALAVATGLEGLTGVTDDTWASLAYAAAAPIVGPELQAELDAWARETTDAALAAAATAAASAAQKKA
jgi:tRNA-dihydrouridine synthase